MDWVAALFFLLLMGAAWLGIETRRRRDTSLSRQRAWIRLAIGVYGLAVLAVIAVAGSKF